MKLPRKYWRGDYCDIARTVFIITVEKGFSYEDLRCPFKNMCEREDKGKYVCCRG